jgi:prepilin-type N-terminal cleavage/methylation domain-containing protein
MKRSFLFCPPTHKVSGFTLVEVLLSVTIFAIIAVSVAGTFFSGIKLWDRVRGTDFVKTSFLIDLEKVAVDVRQAMDVPVIGYTGSAEEFSFPSIEKDSIMRLMYYFDPVQQALIRKTQSLSSILEEKTDPAASTTEIFNASNVTFQYLVKNANSTDWESGWKKDDGIIHAVKLEGVSNGVPFSKIIVIPISE